MLLTFQIHSLAIVPINALIILSSIEGSTRLYNDQIHQWKEENENEAKNSWVKIVLFGKVNVFSTNVENNKVTQTIDIDENAMLYDTRQEAANGKPEIKGLLLNTEDDIKKLKFYNRH